MDSNNNLENMEDFVPEIDTTDSTSIDDFIKQLEAKERDLHISSEMVIEVDEPTFDDTNPSDFTAAEISAETVQTKDITAPEYSIPNSIASEENSQLKLQISKLEVDCIGLTESLRRRQTDFDNFKNRVERERSETFTNQISNLAAQMLPVLDNLNRALEFAERHNEASSEDFHQFFQGIVLVNQQVNEVLGEMGVSPIVSIGEPFDPHFHEAVATEETDAYPPNTVTGEFLRGYRIGGKLIRAAMVKVAVPPKPEAAKMFSEEDLAAVEKFFEAE